jgi:flagellar motor switch protein FliN/FliY
MVDEFLNQDEIDALLSGGSSSDGEGGGGAAGSGVLKPDDISVLAEVVGIIAGAASNVIGMLAGRDVVTNLLDQLEIPQSEMAAHVGSDKVFAYSMLLSGLDSPAQLLTTERGALTLADLMMGGDAQDLPSEANDLYLSASQEGLSQVMGSALTNLGGLMAGVKLVADNSSSSLEDASSWIPFASDAGDMPIWVGRIELTVDGIDPFVLNVALPLANTQDLVARVRAAMIPEEETAPPQAKAASAPQRQVSASAPQHQVSAQASVPVSLPQRPQGPPVDARPVEFAQLGGTDYAGVPANIDLIVDIPVRITVELGRTRKTIGEVLALGPGSVVELNKMAGEPVDLLVNGKLIARGEVVVIDESFGIRVTEVVSRAERIRSMGV